MFTVFSVFFYVAVGIGALALLSFLSGRYFQLDPEPDQIVFCTTDDSWRLALNRYLPERPIPGALPVVLCPGFGFTGNIFDLDEDSSLARYLTAHGHEVWVLDLRGRGNSDKSRLWGRRRMRWCFDDYTDFDIPAALEAVCQHCGVSQVQWVGFSMGALALLGVEASEVNSRCRSLAALAASTSFKRQRELITPWIIRLLQLAWNRHTMRLLAPLLGRLPIPPLKALQNQDNIDPVLYRRALINSICRFSSQELEQYRSWLESDSFEAIDQQRNYRKNMAALELPILFVGGPRDPLAPAAAQESSLEGLERAPQRSMVLASRMHGMSTNYGHLDLLVGSNARRDIYPHLLQWLDRHCGAEVPDDRPLPPGEERDLETGAGSLDISRAAEARRTLMASPLHEDEDELFAHPNGRNSSAHESILKARAMLREVPGSESIQPPSPLPLPADEADTAGKPEPAPQRSEEPTAGEREEVFAEEQPADEPGEEADGQPDPGMEPEPEAAGETEPEAAGEPEPEAAGEPEPEAAGEPEPDATGEPEPEAAGEPEPEAAEKSEPPVKDPPAEDDDDDLDLEQEGEPFVPPRLGNGS